MTNSKNPQFYTWSYTQQWNTGVGEIVVLREESTNWLSNPNGQSWKHTSINIQTST